MLTSVASRTLRSRFVFQRSCYRRFASAVPTDTTQDDPGDVTGASSSSASDTTHSTNTVLQSNLRPSEIVKELDLHIVGQQDAKRSVAIALRNRWRRKQLPEDLRKEIMPRNVLLVGPTGCGKTEVARRMAKLNDAPFIKVEATKFTEVGYHGRDVDKIISDLMDISMQLARKRQTEKFKTQAATMVEDRLLDILTGPSSEDSRESFRDMLRDGSLDDQEIDVEVPQKNRNNDVSFNEGISNIVSMMMAHEQGAKGGGKQTMKRVKLPIAKARQAILDLEIDKLLSNVDLKKEAINAVEESGIVFIDEIDKICSASGSYSSKSADASAEGVQRDLLPLVEGTTISTKYGNVNTDYILFVASGAFHAVKPSDLLPELQGRFPVRVELKGLTEDDLYKILTEPVANTVRQQIELLKTEGVTLVFEDESIREIARMAAEFNRTVENIGARRLHTIMEKIMEQISFDAAEMDDETTITVDKQLVERRLKDVKIQNDMSKFIL